MKLSEINFSTKNIEQIGEFQKLPTVPRPNLISSDSFVNTNLVKQEENQNFIQKAFNKLKSIFSFAKKDVNSSNENETLDLDTSKVTNNSFVSFKAKAGNKKISNLSQTEKQYNEYKIALLEELNVSEQDLNTFLDTKLKNNTSISLKEIISTIQSNNIPIKDFISLYNSKKTQQGEQFDKVALVSTIQTLRNYQHVVCKEVFEPFNFGLKDVDKVLELSAFFNVTVVEEFLESKNQEVFEKIFCDNKYAEYSEKLSETMKELYSRINMNSFMYSNTEQVTTLSINGENKVILFPNSKKILPMIIPIEKENNINYEEEEESVPKEIRKKRKNEITALFIKSDLMTMDLINAIKNNEFKIPEKYQQCSSKVPTKDGTIELKFNTNELINKATDPKKGFSTLSSHEIHALTDTFLKLYVYNGSFRELSKSILGKSESAKNIYGHVVYLQEIAERILKPRNMKIEPHAIMRMLDRNMVLIADNKNGKMLSFEEGLTLLAEKAKTSKANKDGEFFIDGKERKADKLISILANGSTIKCKKLVEDGKIVLDTVMFQ